MPHAQPLTGTIEQIGCVGHALHATGHHHIDTASQQSVMGDDRRLHARTAHLVQGGAHRGLGQPDRQRRLARRCLTEAGGQHTTHQHFLYRLGGQTTALDRSANRRSTELRGGNTGKFTLEGTHGRAGTPDDDHWILLHRGPPQRAAMRSAPSRRITSPFSMGFSMIWRTSAAYSCGSPRRGGKGTSRARESRTTCDIPAIIGVSKMPGAMVITRIPWRASSRAIGRVMLTTPPLEAA